MKKIEIYDPALCCSTGVCGPSPDTDLAAFASAVASLKDHVEVRRYNLAQEPGAFANEPLVQLILQREGPDSLPVILVDGEIVLKGVYPTVEQLAHWAGLRLAGGCCGDEDDSCCSGEENESDCCSSEESESKSDCCGGSSCC